MKYLKDLNVTININNITYIEDKEDKVIINFTGGKTLTINCYSVERAKELHKRIIGQ